jgi:hypothetical protein
MPCVVFQQTHLHLFSPLASSFLLSPFLLSYYLDQTKHAERGSTKASSTVVRWPIVLSPVSSSPIRPRHRVLAATHHPPCILRAARRHGTESIAWVVVNGSFAHRHGLLACPLHVLCWAQLTDCCLSSCSCPAFWPSFVRGHFRLLLLRPPASAYIRSVSSLTVHVFRSLLPVANCLGSSVGCLCASTSNLLRLSTTATPILAIPSRILTFG